MTQLPFYFFDFIASIFFRCAFCCLRVCVLQLALWKWTLLWNAFNSVCVSIGDTTKNKKWPNASPSSSFSSVVSWCSFPFRQHVTCGCGDRRTEGERGELAEVRVRGSRSNNEGECGVGLGAVVFSFSPSLSLSTRSF